MADCSRLHTHKLIFQNATGDTAEICYAQATSRYQIGGYIDKTAVHTLVTNGGQGTFGINDLCTEKGELIAATSGSISVLMRKSSGQTERFDDSLPEAADGKYYANVGWVIHPKTVVNLDGETEEKVVLEPVHFEYYEFEGVGEDSLQSEHA